MSGEAPGQPTDATLLRQHANGDTEAFGLLFRRHKDRLWAVALRITCDPDDAADALQDAGCDSEEILAHCRDPKTTHVRGCWVVDLVLGKE